MMILDRMADALRTLDAKWKGKRLPKAFYLGSADWAEFAATDPPSMESTWNNKLVDEPVFSGVPVRSSKNVPPRSSRLYDHTGTGRLLPS